MLSFVIICIITGGFTGFLAGLLGIEGGIIVIPVLHYLFTLIDMPKQYIMISAIATAMASIVITSSIAAQRHYKLGNCDIKMGKRYIPRIIPGALIGAFLASVLPGKIVAIFFTLLVIFVFLRNFINIIRTSKSYTKENSQETSSSNIKVYSGFRLTSYITSVSFICGTAGAAGGVFYVPYFHRMGYKMPKAVGTSSLGIAATSLMITIAFIVYGLKAHMPAYSLGYIYLPAFFSVIIGSFITSRIGAKTATFISTRTLRKLFVLVVFLIIVLMLNTFFHFL
ncbi:MAG: sulfite exporter TauE/SafE family protein [Psittacicella sp.]